MNEETSDRAGGRPTLALSGGALLSCLCAVIVTVGCASTKITNRQAYEGGQLPRPGHIWVYDFAATPGDVPPESSLMGRLSDHQSPQTAQEIGIGRELADRIATDLVREIRGMGLPAERAGDGTTPQINDLLIRGYLLSIRQGNEAERVAVGFGAGASELKTAVEGYQVTSHGPRRLGSETLDAGGGKTPGAALGVVGLAATANPAGLILSTGMKVYGEESGRSRVEGRADQTAKEIGDALRAKFREQGWLD